METTSNAKIHAAALFTIAVLLLVPSFLSIGGVAGPLSGMSKAWYWAGVFSPLICGLISFSGGMRCYRKKTTDALSRAALWLGSLSLYILVIIWGVRIQQVVNASSFISGVIMYASRFVLPLLAAWLLGVKPVLPLALLPTIIQLANISRYPESAGYIILSATGCLISVVVFVVEPFQLAGGGKLCPVLMVACAFSDATLMQMIFNVAAIRTVDHAVSIGIVEFLPFIILTPLLHIFAIRKK